MLQTMNKINTINDLAIEVLQIEADSILELKNRINEDFEKAIGDYLTFEFSMIMQNREYLFERGVDDEKA